MNLDNLINYLKQPSTYKGIAKIAAAMGFVGFPEFWPLVIAGLVVVDGLIDTLRNENPTDPKEQARIKLMQAKAKAVQLGIKDE